MSNETGSSHERGTVPWEARNALAMPVTAVAMMTMTAVVMVATSAEAKAKARPVEVPVVVRAVVVRPVGPYAPAMPMPTMPPAPAHPHDVLYGRIFVGGCFQAVSRGAERRGLGRR
jgi:hypothetical protein